ncbi:MAG TPA: hypothetical protein VFX76_03460, partial [Roseiflexaceae bacterium]|nr:hypothetical protein [Roseiflexaceae bacterium]
MRRVQPLVALLALLGMLVVPRSALAKYTSTLAGQAITLNGDGEPDTLSIGVDLDGPNAGRLRHNRFIPDSPAFADPYDFDSALAGSQMVTAGPGVTMAINAGGGNDSIVISSFAGHSGVVVNIDGGLGNDSIRLVAPGSTPAQVNVAGGSGDDT